MFESISKCNPLWCLGEMFRRYSPFFAPVFLPERVVDEGGGAPACYAFIAIVQGALKKVEEEEEEG